MFAEHDFIVFMEPCLVATYDATTVVSLIVYNVNQSTLTDGFYQFDETPVCNYPETVTVTNLPVWTTHNEPSSDFTIPQNPDLSLIGEYTVTLRSEICVPTDYSQADCTVMFVEYDFLIQVEECIVNDYTADQVIGTISYNIGAPTLTTPMYTFTEDPPCYYPETVFVTNMPAFMTHDEAASDFTIPQMFDLSLLGSYTMTLRSEIYIPTDYTTTDFTTMFVEYDILILIEPCLITSYTDTTTVSLIIYNIGAPDLTDGLYVFDEDPVCNYPETVTLTNLPTWSIHNEPASDFTIPLNSDLDLIGEYTVTLRSEIQVPDDYTGLTFTTWTVEYDFLIQIEECVITSYDATLTIPTLTYIIGDPELVSSSYLFDETPFCGYDETVTVTNLPTWAIHDGTAKNFRIPKNEDLSLDATYTVTLRSEIQVPDDYTETTFTTWFQEYTFDIVLIDPCETSTIDDFVLNDMERSVKQPSDSQTIIDPTDLISRTYGNLDGYAYCGPREFEITNLPTTTYSNFLSFDQATNTFTYGTNLQSDVGVYNLELRAYLVNYPAVELLKPFIVEIVYCQVTDLDQTLLPVQKYDIYTPAIQFSTLDFVQTPDCGYTLEYEIRIKDVLTGTYTPVPTFIQQLGFLSFDVFTDVPTDIGVYQISIIGRVPAAFMNPVYKEELLIELQVNDGCEDDEVTTTDTIPFQLYYIAETGLVSFKPTWTHTELGCPITYEIGRFDDTTGLERALTADESSVLVQDKTNGWLDIQTSDYALDGETWKIRLYMRSTFATNPKQDGPIIFDIEFRDICWDSNLQAASFIETIVYYDVWQLQSNLFDKMVDLDQGLLCGGYTHEILYVSGPKFDASLAPQNADLSPYTLDEVPPTQMAMNGVVSDFSWLGSHRVIIKSTLGSEDLTATARGNQGLFLSVLSTELEIQIINPCLTSVVNGDSGLVIDDLFVPVGSDVLDLVYAGPTDSTSVTYGNGYDKCGDLLFEWLNVLTGAPFENAYFNSTSTVVGFNVDSFNQLLISEKTGTTLSDTMLVRMSLVDYPSSTPAEFTVKLTYRECFPLDFSGPEIDDVKMKVGEQGPEIDYFFDQFPCSWNQTYEIVIVTPSGETKVLPAFFDSDGTLIIINEPATADIGTYDFEICSQIDNSLNTRSCTEFTVKIEPLNTANITVTKEPEWIISLQNQRVKVGDSLLYAPGIQFNTYGYLMEVSAELGDAFRFSKYETDTNLYKVNGDITTKDDIGIYMITISARFYDESYSEKYTKSFFLEVWDDPEIVDPWVPEDPIEYQYWDGGVIREDAELEPFDPEKPVPYIVDLSTTGVLTIGWDRIMVPPGNYTVIPTAQVAIRKWDEIIESVNDRRMLNQEKLYRPRPTGEKVWFADFDDRYYERLLLLDALEIQIQPDDQDEGVKVSFEWDILGYDTDYIWLQLVIDNPWDVSADGQFDTIFVTFWGTEYFKSINNKEVRYGTVISQKIFRQISTGAASSLDGLDFSMGIFGLDFLMILPFVTLGSLLPTWMFVNALQLLAHLPLLNSQMPGNAHYFLNKYLDIVRWYDEDFIDNMQEKLSLKTYDTDVGIFHELLKACGYEHLFVHNMLLIFLAICIICSVWLGLAIKDLIGKLTKSKRAVMQKRHGKWCNNFALRFFYEFFLEFCIVLFINLSVVDWSAVSPSFSYLSSLVITILAVLLVLFIISLLFCGGPYVNGYYQKRTVSSIWGNRPLNPDFDTYAFLKANKKQKKRKGWYKFHLGGKKPKSGEGSGSPESDGFDALPQFTQGADTQNLNLPIARTNNDQQFSDKDSTPYSSAYDMVANNDPVNSMQTDRKLLITPIDTPRMPSLPFRNYDKSDGPRGDEGMITTEAAGPLSKDYFQPMTNTNKHTLGGPNNTYDDLPFPASMKNRADFAEKLQNLADLTNYIQKHPEEQVQESDSSQEEQSSIIVVPEDNITVKPVQEESPIVHLERSLSLSRAAFSNERDRVTNIENVTPLKFMQSNATGMKDKNMQQSQYSLSNRGEQFEGGEVLDTHAPMIDDAAQGTAAMNHFKRLRLIEERKEQASALQHQAKQRIELADAVPEPARYKTLYYGLKRNHQRNVAVIHPLMFLLRRIIFALVIVFMDTIPIWGVLIFMYSTLIMLAYTLSEQQWKDPLIQQQHIFNECTLYILSVLMLLFSNYLDGETRYLLGFFLILICFIFVVYNTIIMLLFSCKFFILIVRKEYSKKSRKKLSKEIKQVVRHIEVKLEEDGEWFQPDKDWFNPDEGCNTVENKDAKHMVSMKVLTSTTFCGGFTGAILPVTSKEVVPAVNGNLETLEQQRRKGKINQVFIDVDMEAIGSPVLSSGQKDQKLIIEEERPEGCNNVSDDQSPYVQGPEVGVELIDQSTGRHGNHDVSKEDSVDGDGIKIDRHTFSPQNSMLIVPGNTRRNADKKGNKRSGRKQLRLRDLDIEDSMDSKDFFEPDDISVISAPRKIMSVGLQGLNEELKIDKNSQARLTAQQFFKPKLFTTLGQKKQQQQQSSSTTLNGQESQFYRSNEEMKDGKMVPNQSRRMLAQKNTSNIMTMGSAGTQPIIHQRQSQVRIGEALNSYYKGASEFEGSQAFRATKMTRLHNNQSGQNSRIGSQNDITCSTPDTHVVNHIQAIAHEGSLPTHLNQSVANHVPSAINHSQDMVNEIGGGRSATRIELIQGNAKRGLSTTMSQPVFGALAAGPSEKAQSNHNILHSARHYSESKRYLNAKNGESKQDDQLLSYKAVQYGSNTAHKGEKKETGGSSRKQHRYMHSQSKISLNAGPALMFNTTFDNCKSGKVSVGATSVRVQEPGSLSVERCDERNASPELRSLRANVQRHASQPLSSGCKQERQTSQKRMSEHGARILTSMNSVNNSKEELNESFTQLTQSAARVKAMTRASNFLKSELVKEQQLLKDMGSVNGSYFSNSSPPSHPPGKISRDKQEHASTALGLETAQDQPSHQIKFSYKEAQTGHLGLVKSSGVYTNQTPSGRVSVAALQAIGSQVDNQSDKHQASAFDSVSDGINSKKHNNDAIPLPRSSRRSSQAPGPSQQMHGLRDTQRVASGGEKHVSSHMSEHMGSVENLDTPNGVATSLRKSQSNRKILSNNIKLVNNSAHNLGSETVKNYLDQHQSESESKKTQLRKQSNRISGQGSLHSTDFRQYETLLENSSQFKKSVRNKKEDANQNLLQNPYGAMNGDDRRASRVVSQASIANSLRFVEKNTKFDDKDFNSIQRTANELLSSAHNSEHRGQNTVAYKEEDLTPLTAALRIEQTAKSLAVQQQNYRKLQSQREYSSGGFTKPVNNKAESEEEVTPLTAALQAMDKPGASSYLPGNMNQTGTEAIKMLQQQQTDVLSMQDSFTGSVITMTGGLKKPKFNHSQDQWQDKAAMSQEPGDWVSGGSAIRQKRVEAMQKMHSGPDIMQNSVSDNLQLQSLYSAGLHSPRDLTSDKKNKAPYDVYSTKSKHTPSTKIYFNHDQGVDTSKTPVHKIGNKLNIQHRQRHSMQMTPGSVAKAVMMQPGMGAVIEEDSLDPYNLESQVLEFNNNKSQIMARKDTAAGLQSIEDQSMIETQSNVSSEMVGNGDGSFVDILRKRLKLTQDSNDNTVQVNDTLSVGIAPGSTGTASSQAHTVARRGKRGLMEHAESSTLLKGTAPPNLLQQRRPTQKSFQARRSRVNDQTVSRLRQAYNQPPGKSSVSRDRNMTMQRKPTRLQSQLLASQQIDNQSAETPGNRVFNINVKTDDKTKPEDYPHEIDPENYPIMQELGPSGATRNVRERGQTIHSSTVDHKHPKVNNSMVKIRSEQIGPTMSFRSNAVLQQKTMLDRSKTSKLGSGGGVIPDPTGQSEFNVNLGLGAHDPHASFAGSLGMGGFSVQSSTEEMQNTNQTPAGGEIKRSPLKNYLMSAAHNQGRNFIDANNILIENSKSLASYESIGKNSSEQKQQQQYRDKSQDRHMRKTIAKNVLSRIPKITEELQRSVESQNNNVVSMNYSLAGTAVNMSEHRGTQRVQRKNSKALKESFNNQVQQHRGTVVNQRDRSRSRKLSLARKF